MHSPNLIIFGAPLFEGITNKTCIDEHDFPFLQIKHQGALYHVKIASTQAELQQVKRLADLAFPKHQEVSVEELKRISVAGNVLTLANEEGVLVAQTHILTSPTPEHAQVAENEAYCFGTAIRPGDEEKGYAQLLYKAQEVIAREVDKKKMTLTVRVEDVQSIRSRLKAGFRILGYESTKYGPEAGATELIMQKSLTAETFPFDPIRQTARVRRQQTPVIFPTNQETILASVPAEIAILVSSTGEVDVTTHRLVEKALSSGYIGTGLLTSAEYDGENSQQCLFIFQRKDSPLLVEPISSPVQVYSEFGRLREVIVSYSPETAVFKLNNKKGTQNYVDAIAFKEEHEAFLAALKGLGVSVAYTGAFAKNGKNALFTRDPAFVLGGVLVIGKFAMESRKHEAEGMRQLAQGVPVVETGDDEDAVIEGGDIVLVAEKIVAVGLGQRTNEKGLQKLAELFPDYQFIGVRHPDLHLDLLFTVTGEKKALAITAQLPPEFLAFLKEKAGYQIIEADHLEQKRLGCNVLAVDNNTVIAAAENKVTNQRLVASGVEVIEVSMPNIIKSGGGPRCLTCPTRRE